MQPQNILLDSTRRLLRRNGDRNLARILERSRPADIAALLRHFTPAEVVRVYRLIPNVDLRAEVLAEADPILQNVVAQDLSDSELMDLLRQMSGDDAADVIERLPQDRAATVLAAWKDEQSLSLDTLLAYGPETAGGIMSPHVFALPEDTNCQEAIATLQEQHEDLEITWYLYVLNDHGQLVGVCSLRQLLLHEPHTPLHDFMVTNLVSVETHTHQEEVARLVAKYDLLAIPVVNDTNQLMGVVTVDDVIDVIREEATKDILMMAGAGVVDLDDMANPTRNVLRRMPWLLASFCGGLGSMLVIGAFEDALQQVAALAAFIPITIGMGGNVATQASTVVTRGLALGRIPTDQFLRVVGREVLTGAMLGMAYGALLGLVAALTWGRGMPTHALQLSITVGLAMLCSLTMAATMGGAVPMLMQRFGVDPAVATGPFVTTSVDVIGITVYFLIASALMGL
jgi:magnesium transporter